MHSSAKVEAAYPEFPICRSYDDLKGRILNIVMGASPPRDARGLQFFHANDPLVSSRFCRKYFEPSFPILSLACHGNIGVRGVGRSELKFNSFLQMNL